MNANLSNSGTSTSPLPNFGAAPCDQARIADPLCISKRCSSLDAITKASSTYNNQQDGEVALGNCLINSTGSSVGISKPHYNENIAAGIPIYNAMKLRTNAEGMSPRLSPNTTNLTPSPLKYAFKNIPFAAQLSNSINSASDPFALENDVPSIAQVGKAPHSPNSDIHFLSPSYLPEHIVGALDLSPVEHCLNDIILNIPGTSRNNDKGSPNLVDDAQNQILHERQLSDTEAIFSNCGNKMGVGVNYLDVGCIKLNSSSCGSPNSQNIEFMARYSRKVFVGGLPPDIDEDEITNSFRRFGALVVDWPHKAESKSYFPPKGYAFLLFQDEKSVQQLIEACMADEEKLYLCVSSPTIKDKPVQIRPWRLSDADYVLDASMSLDPRKTVFVGGVPRPLKAVELAMIMDRLYGGVCYAGIDTDPELKYPKGAGRVAFANQQSYIAAISARFVQLQHGDIDKRVEVKPYVLDDQMCDECEGQRCSGKFAPFFCANVTCLQYYCENCWAAIHSRPGREYHKPLVKEGADRPRAVPFRWC